MPDSLTHQHLVAWTCGPVQSFIAAARKGRDLWFGSWLLSEVATAAALAFIDLGGTLILPAPTSRAELKRADYDVPNQILARVPVEPAAAARAAENAARARLSELAEKVFDHLTDRRKAGQLYDRERAEEQVEDLLEIHWAATRATTDDRRDRRRVYALLAARKSLRSFRAPVFASWGVEKSSIDGVRECVTKKGAGLRLGLHREERLCGVGLVKRLGHRHAPAGAPGGRVASVSMFALLSWLRAAIDKDRSQVEAAIRQFARQLEDGLGDVVLPEVWKGPAHPLFHTLDPHWFYASRLREFIPEGADEDEVARQHGNALAAFKRELELSGEPNPYYAVLLGDGDRLGQLMDGLDSDQVRTVSAVLSRFTREVRDTVFAEERLEGLCVYAGGDDVLALVPVDVALRKARELSEAFGREFAKESRALGVADGRNLPTFSVGIVVAHHLTPLQDVLDKARAAERIAKDTAGRDAWALTVDKRSGSPLTVYAGWSAKGGSGRPPDLALRDLVRASGRGGVIPRSLAHAVKRAELRLEPRSVRTEYMASHSTVPAAVQRSELERILQQKMPLKGTSDDSATIESARMRLRELLAESSLGGLADRLVMARTLSGMGALA